MNVMKRTENHLLLSFKAFRNPDGCRLSTFTRKMFLKTECMPRVVARKKITLRIPYIHIPRKYSNARENKPIKNKMNTSNLYTLTKAGYLSSKTNK